MWIADAARCREIDRRSAEEFGIASEDLMERAGKAVFEALVHLVPPSGRIGVVCGRGNNGGDGLVVARLTHQAGYRVDCLVAAAEPSLTLEAEAQLAKARAIGVRPAFAADPQWGKRLEELAQCDAVVDALLGIGASGPPREPVTGAIGAIRSAGRPVVAVDVPSGIHCDTGAELGLCVRANRTVTFGLPKPFLFQGAGPEMSGSWSVADIGFPKALLDEPTDAATLHLAWVGSRLPKRAKGSHKGDNGHVLVVAGSDAMPGAASLAARAALRAGAGLATVASTPEVCRRVAALAPEALLMPLSDSGGVVGPKDAAVILASAEKFDAAVFGPGLSDQAPVREFLEAVFAEWTLPTSVDADALNAIAQGVGVPKGPLVLTPHPGEMGRLLGSTAAAVQADRFGAARAAAERFAGTVLLKGAHSVAAHGSEPLLVNETGNPGMAAGGMGDVLAGVVGTLLAQGLTPRDAAACAMAWHGLAGDLAATEIGPVGFLASDIAERLPAARAKIAAACTS